MTVLNNIDTIGNTMKDFQRLLYNRNGSQLAMGFDLEKINHGDRVVVGFATLDNIDFAGDIVDSKASLEAFKAFRGNVRSQHDKHKPVGRVIAFQPSTYYDSETQKTYNGIKVAVRVSEGAEDVWKMCQDGTLSGFSIGGAVKKAKKVWNDELKKHIQVIEEIMFTELSLVDNPMNKLANITSVSVHKSLDYDTIEKDFNTMNLFWCAVDKLAAKSAGVDNNCPSCGEAMANMGHIEENVDIEKQLEAIFAIESKGGHPEVGDTEITIEKAADAEDIVTEAADNEGTEPQEEELFETSEETEEDSTAEGTEESNSDEGAEGTEEILSEGLLEEEAENAEESEEEVDPAVALAETMKSIQEALDKSKELVEKGQDQLRTDFNSLSEEIQKQLGTLSESQKKLEERIDSVSEKLNDTHKELEETQKRFDSTVAGTAVRKSVDSQAVNDRVVAKKGSLFSGVFDPKPRG